jgi:hypothetical protein
MINGISNSKKSIKKHQESGVSDMCYLCSENLQKCSDVTFKGVTYMSVS